jgi:hypothetical protein
MDAAPGLRDPSKIARRSRDRARLRRPLADVQAGQVWLPAPFAEVNSPSVKPSLVQLSPAGLAQGPRPIRQPRSVCIPCVSPAGALGPRLAAQWHHVCLRIFGGEATSWPRKRRLLAK